MVMISKFLFKFTRFCVVICFLNETINIMYFISAAAHAELATKSVGILVSISLMLAL